MPIRGHRLARMAVGNISRERLLDVDRRLAPARRNATIVLAIALLICSP